MSFFMFRTVTRGGFCLTGLGENLSNEARAGFTWHICSVVAMGPLGWGGPAVPRSGVLGGPPRAVCPAAPRPPRLAPAVPSLLPAVCPRAARPSPFSCPAARLLRRDPVRRSATHPPRSPAFSPSEAGVAGATGTRGPPSPGLTWPTHKRHSSPLSCVCP